MKWKYLNISIAINSFERDADVFGNIGWELVQAFTVSNDFWFNCIFKRLIPEETAAELERPNPTPVSELQIIGNMPPAYDYPPQTSSADFPPQHEGGVPYCDKIIEARERKAYDRQHCLDEKDANNVLSFCEWDDWQSAI
jgi:hypothetical protein